LLATALNNRALAFIVAGFVVTRDVSADALDGGNPTRVLRSMAG
jgi:acetyltransferase-like isoleucine patch superfamily enzyme